MIASLIIKTHHYENPFSIRTNNISNSNGNIPIPFLPAKMVASAIDQLNRIAIVYGTRYPQ